ncbi:UNVERIFIED_CONTAM: hypothetical protein PYX00_000529 [Menopon gallinae]|uniref:Uncharacterized protein n=1 Tax=Menopon gallinae TaxID=328185 RepID=A0AAW2I9J7_9NEOP
MIIYLPGVYPDFGADAVRGRGNHRRTGRRRRPADGRRQGQVSGEQGPGPVQIDRSGVLRHREVRGNTGTVERYDTEHRQERDNKRIGNRLLRHRQGRDPPEGAHDRQRAVPLRLRADSRILRNPRRIPRGRDQD